MEIHNTKHQTTRVHNGTLNNAIAMVQILEKKIDRSYLKNLDMSNVAVPK